MTYSEGVTKKDTKLSPCGIPNECNLYKLMYVVLFANQYTASCISGPGVNLPADPFYPGCDCHDHQCEVDRNCSCVVKYGPIYERKNGLLLKTDTRQSNGKVYWPRGCG